MKKSIQKINGKIHFKSCKKSSNYPKNYANSSEEPEIVQRKLWLNYKSILGIHNKISSEVKLIQLIVSFEYHFS